MISAHVLVFLAHLRAQATLLKIGMISSIQGQMGSKDRFPCQKEIPVNNYCSNVLKKNLDPFLREWI